MIDLDRAWDKNKRQDAEPLLAALVAEAGLSAADRASIVARATQLVKDIRAASRPTFMDVMLAEYGLSTDEGVALMCLAEALLRVPDAETMDALIEDKVVSSDWSRHIGQSSSPLVNASTWGLMLTGRILNAPDESFDAGIADRLRSMVKRVGEPVIRTAVSRAMREMGQQFVLGETINAAMARAREAEVSGYTYSYDMLGEAAMTSADAARYADAYSHAIDAIASACTSDEIAQNPGISVKLSALHPRYEVAKAERVIREVTPVLLGLARKAAAAGMGLNVDAEEMDRLGLSMAVIDAILSAPDLAGWAGFGVVVQGYGRRAGDIIDALYARAAEHDRTIMVRLVKGAYWDSEIKHAQVEGLTDFPVFTRKAETDVSYIGLAKRLLAKRDRIYPQFATHNAHSVSTILHMARNLPKGCFEFQRLHGMGEALHDLVKASEGTRCRIYAPVGAHRDLLAYLVRRLLENGANSSFVNQIVDEDVAPEVVAACPYEEISDPQPLSFRRGPDLFQPERVNSTGFDLSDTTVLDVIAAARPDAAGLAVQPILTGPAQGGETEPILDPSNGQPIGLVTLASEADIETALATARPWAAAVEERATILNRAAELYEADFGTAFSLLAAEAGKTLADCVAELREAVDFLRYYAARAAHETHQPRGLFACISPWNFPLAIFTGQIAAALATGNGVLAKPAEATPAIAAWAVQKLHDAGVPPAALQLLPGHGHSVGAALTSDPRINGIAFTGSTATARRIQSAMADTLEPGIPLIAETGGLNAMIVDSTALPEQAVRDIVSSAFQSAGQRCSALRCVYVQDDVLPRFQMMLMGAMDELSLGNPGALATDLGPVITPQARADIEDYVAEAKSKGQLLHRLKAPVGGSFVAPALIAVDGIEDLTHEVFGPILHIASFDAGELDQVIEAINATGYGLTFGLHTRIDDRVQKIADAVDAGNIYANRDQIGAIVGSQPFGGEGLSGTGPKAGGPHYLSRFTKSPAAKVSETFEDNIDTALLEDLISNQPRNSLVETSVLPGPTGELNRLSTLARAPVLCLGPGVATADRQANDIEALGGTAVRVPDAVAPDAPEHLSGIGGVIWWGGQELAREYAKALARREGPIIPLIVDRPDKGHARQERHLCVDTTAAGGNTSLLAGQDD